MSIELQKGTECLISDSSDAELYAAFEGDGNYILRKPLDLTMSSTNTLIIGPGTGLQNGRHIRFKGTTEVTIPSGVQAEKRSNIVVVRTTISRDEDTMETLTHSEAMVLTGKSTMDGEPTDPEWIEGNLLDGDTIADFPIARVVTDGINVREPEPLYNVLASAADFRDSQSRKPIIKTVQLSTMTIAANSIGRATGVKPVIEEYECVGITFFGASNGWVNTQSAGIASDGAIEMSFFNPHATSQQVWPSVGLLYLPV